MKLELLFSQLMTKEKANYASTVTRSSLSLKLFFILQKSRHETQASEHV
jgi:hypothetical protein